MSLRLLLLAVCALSGCASGSTLPTCDGAARRPANPHSSILSPAPIPLAPADAETPPSGSCA